jgi:hypothetical protein
MSFDYPIRVKAAVLLLLVLALLSAVYGILRADIFSSADDAGDDGIEYQTRFDSFKAVLPERGIVGYIGDTQNDRRLERRRARLTQYSLAPLVMAKSAAFPLVIGDFHDQGSERSLLQANGLKLLIDAGNGARLFQGPEDKASSESRVPLARPRAGGNPRPGVPSEAEPGWSSIPGLLWFALPLLIGFLFTCCFLPVSGAPASFHLMRVFIGVGMGLGICSCVAFFSLLSGGMFRGRLLAAESLLLAVLAVFSFRQWKLGQGRAQRPAPPSIPAPGMLRLIAVCFSLAIALGAATFAALAYAEPDGGFDATAIWNLRAKFLFKGGEYWTDGFSPEYIGNLGYPLLVPASVAHGWLFAGDGVAVPITVGLLFTLGAIGLLASVLSYTRSVSQGLLAGSVVLGTPFFLRFGTWQVADVPVAFFFLSSLVLLSLSKYFPSLRYRIVLLAGLCAGLSAWTKNEGLMFFSATVLSLFIVAVAGRRDKARFKDIACYVLGALPVLLVVWYFKTEMVPDLSYAAANPLGASEPGPGLLSSLFSRLSDLRRHFAILTAYQGAIRFFGGGPFSLPIVLVFYLLVLGTVARLKSNGDVSAALATWLLMFGGYYVIYILAPVNLTLYSLDRVLMQLWPSALFIFFMLVRTPEEVFLAGEAQPATAALSNR